MAVSLQQLVGYRPRRVAEMGFGHPLMRGLVREDVERSGEARIGRIEAERRLRVARDRRHVDVTLEASRAAEREPVVEDRKADAADVVADEVMKGEGLRRLELEVREDDEQVVGVAVALVEAPRDRGPRRVVRRDSVGLGRVVARTVVLDDRDRADVTRNTGSGVGKGRQSSCELAEPPPSVDRIELVSRGRSGCGQEGREAGHGQREGGGRAHAACPAAVHLVRACRAGL